MKTEQNENNKTYKVGTSRITYMIFAVLITFVLYLTFFFKPSTLQSTWFVPLFILIYFFFLIFPFTKGEKLIITKNTIYLKGWFVSQKLRISEIDTYKVLSSSLTGNKRIIMIIPKAKKRKMLINHLPHKDFIEFLDWLENKLEKKDKYNIDKIQKCIIHSDKKFTLNILEQNSGLKVYEVGKSIFSTYLLFTFFISATIIIYIFSKWNYLSSQIFMYIQIAGLLLFIIAFIIYVMLKHNKLIITENSIQIKGLFINRELKFHEIKGYKTVYTKILKRYKYVVIIPNVNTKKSIIIRPTPKVCFIELTDWIENNFLKLK